LAGNSFGILLKLTSWGESHGPAIGGVLDGCPAGLLISEDELQKELDRRKPGQSRYSTQRKEPDEVKILSGVFEGKTTGAPIAFQIENRDKDSSYYEKIKDDFRPGHADYTWQVKYGHRDYRGGGRSSARETAVRVAGGAIAKKILGDIDIFGFTKQIGNVVADSFDRNEIENNPVRSPDAQSAKKMEEAIDEARQAGDSLGGIVEVRALNVPVGLGLPVYNRLDGDLASALMGINAVKGVEIGSGFSCVSMRGSEHNDVMSADGDTVSFASNNAGGILGGLSSGNDIVVRIAVKPTPSIITEQDSISISHENIKIATKGRHDPCICPRAVPVAEAMVALVLADHLLINRTSKL